MFLPLRCGSRPFPLTRVDTGWQGLTYHRQMSWKQHWVVSTVKPLRSISCWSPPPLRMSSAVLPAGMKPRPHGEASWSSSIKPSFSCRRGSDVTSTGVQLLVVVSAPAGESPFLRSQHPRAERAIPTAACLNSSPWDHEQNKEGASCNVIGG